MFHTSRITCGISDVCYLFNGHRLVCLLMLAMAGVLTVEAGDPLRYRAGLRLSPDKNKLSEKERKAILASLREKTGLLGLGFDEDGFLSLGEIENHRGGSKTARALLTETAGLSYAIDLESHNNSKEIAFGRLDKPVNFTNFSSGEQIEVYPIQLDFTDFKKLRGDTKVIAAFDIGFVILHELGHAVLGLRDSVKNQLETGECEEYINRIRRELGHPVRESYYARIYHRSIMASLQTIPIAELEFSLDNGSGKARYRLNWPAADVGPIVPAGVRRSSMAASLN